MSTLSKANEARKQKAINSLWNFEDLGIKSFKDLIDAGLFVRGEKAQAPKYKYNRRKFNRMDYAEQEVYEAKLKEMKTVYRLYRKNEDNTCSEVSIFVYEYFTEKQLESEAI